MKPAQLAALEDNLSFKKSYLKHTPWWRTIHIIPPSCFLFLGLVGIIYFLELDKLVSWYALPFIAFFIVGTIWLKAVKKYLQKQQIEKKGSFLVCMATVVDEDDKFVQTIFTTGAKRHNGYYTKNLASHINVDNIEPSAHLKVAEELHDEPSDTNYYIKTFYKKDIKKANANWRDDSYFPVLYISEKYVYPIKHKDLKG